MEGVMRAADEPWHSAAPVIVALSGPIGAGKSSLATALTNRFGTFRLSTQGLMTDAAEAAGSRLEAERRALQNYGEQLDRETDGRWVADGVAKRIAEGEIESRVVVVDAVRTLQQIERLRDAFPSQVIHIHLEAPTPVLEERYQQRQQTSPIDELADYSAASSNPTEARTPDLREHADIAIDTQRCSQRDVLARAAAALRLTADRRSRLVDVLIGGQYGSEGKGNIAYHIAGEYDLLVRVGGPNAGHKVPSDPVYTHRQLPSGTMANPQATLLIGPGATLQVDLLLQEIADCAVERGRLYIDPQAMVIEEEDKAEEQTLVSSIGSTGQGGGAAAARKIMGRRGTSTTVRLARDLEELQPYIRRANEVLEEAYRAGSLVLLEGTQGTALSLHHGLYPYVTSRETTTLGCMAEAGIGPHRLRRVILAVRTYPIRVGSPPDGTSGWMSQPITWETIAERAGLDPDVLRGSEHGSVTRKERRVAEFDWDLLQTASELNGATDIALTFADYLTRDNAHARRFDQLTAETIHFIEEVERVSNARVSLIGTGFDRRSMIDRRDW
jgi:adenylosuccinate synthase